VNRAFADGAARDETGILDPVARMILEAGGVSVWSHLCRTPVSEPAEVVLGCTVEERTRAFVKVVLTQQGTYSYRDSRGRATVDPVSCVMTMAGQASDVGHPATHGDLGTYIFLTIDAWYDLAGDAKPSLAAPVSGTMQLAHHRLVTGAKRGFDEILLEEYALHLIRGAIAHAKPAKMFRARTSTLRSRQQLADDARWLLIENPTIPTVSELAVRLSVSPYHLSRVFHDHTGQTISAYRTASRVNLALSLLQQGSSLADVASRCGFADHAHLTRTLRSHTGVPPKALRRLFG
jgi:AraC-like DNA-binding protein